MKLLSKIIHSGQYQPSVSNYEPAQYSSPAAELPKPEAPVFPAGTESIFPSGPGGRIPEEQEKAKQLIEQAFLKAKEIIASAQQYQTEKIREADEAILSESAEAKRHGYTDGYAEGTERGRKEGSEAGYRAGLEDGRRQAQADNRRALDELGMMIEAVEKSKTKILRDFEDDLVDLSTAMAKAILKHEIQTDEKALRSIILSAMGEYRNQAWIRIYVPQDSANVLLKADGGIASALSEISDSVKVVVSQDMDDGGCVIETPDQVIDAGLDSQLAKIRKAITEAMRNKPEN